MVFFKNWSIWRWVVIAVLVLAILGALIVRSVGLAFSLVVLLVICTVADRAVAKFTKCRTPARLVWAAAALAALWLVVYLALVPAVSEMAAVYPDAQGVTKVASALGPLVHLDSGRKVYLALAITVPFLLYIFGAGPLSQHGMQAAAGDNAPPAGSEEG